eukprot:m.130258 g.130258  ORF g.130258 m.130258 type:complete len:220 (-) comp9446_c0_seq2:399-1058(-)
MACSNLWVLYALLDRKRKPKVAKLTSKITKKLLAELESGHIETTQQCIRFVFKTCKVLVTAPTMRAHLRAQGLWNYIKQRKPYVTTLDKKRRVEVAKELMRFSDADLNKIVFTDEKEVTQDAPGHKKRVWRPKGAPFDERRMLPSRPFGGIKANMWVAITATGILGWRFYETPSPVRRTSRSCAMSCSPRPSSTSRGEASGISSKTTAGCTQPMRSSSS